MPPGKEVRDGMGPGGILEGSWRILTCFFILQQLHSFGLGVRLISTVTQVSQARIMLKGLVILFCSGFLPLEVVKGGDWWF